MFMFKSNEPIKNAHPQKLANQLLLNGALVMEMVNNSFSESKKKKRYENILLLDFAPNNMLVSECIFKLVCHCESNQRFVVRKRHS